MQTSFLRCCTIARTDKVQSHARTRRYFITGSQRLSNYFWASFISFGGIGFLTTAFISFLGGMEKGQEKLFKTLSLDTSISSLTLAKEFNPSNISTTNTIQFFPQGFIMGFYGSLGLLFGVYLWANIIWKVGSGFNEFNKKSGVVRIFRWGLPGNDRRIDFTYQLKEISAVRVLLKEGVNPRRSIALLLKGKQEIPLTRIGQPIALQDIENEASSLAQFLQVSLETFYS